MNENAQCFGCDNYMSEPNPCMDTCKVFPHGIPDALQFNVVPCRDRKESSELVENSQ